MKKNSCIKVAVVVPTFNEQDRIGRTVGNMPQLHQQDDIAIEFTLIVVDDGSTDKTLEKVQPKENATIISHTINLGAGGATRTGIHYALKKGFQYIVTMDADGQHLPKDVIKIAVESVKKEYDFVIGTRLVDPSGMPWYKILGNKGLSWLTWLIIGVYSTDSQSGLRFFSAAAARSISWHTDRFGFCSEMLLSARRNKFVVNEIPISAVYDEYSKAKGQSNWNAVNIIKSLLSARLRSLMYE